MRLIDADALIAEIVGTTTFVKDSVLFQKMVDEAPTIEPSGDLISRDDAIEAVRKLKIVEDNKNYPDYAYNAGIETAIKTIELMLSADAEEYIKECNTKTHDLVHRDAIIPSAEAVQVVRCKDCRHRYEEGDCTHYYWCRLNDRPIDDTDFCAWGERKGGDTE